LNLPLNLPWRNPKIYDGKFDTRELEEWIRAMEKIFVVVETPERQKVNIGILYFAGEVDIWWSIVKDKLQRLDFTWAKLLEELRAKFYSITIER